MPRVKDLFNNLLIHVKTHKKILLVIIPVIIIGALIIIFRPKNSNEILTEEVKKQDVTKIVSVTGNVDADISVNLSFLTAGKLSFLGVKQGDNVKKNETIATLDTRTVVKNLQSALIDYSKQRNTFEQTLDTNNADSVNDAVNDSVKRILQNNQFDLDKAVNSVDLQSLAKENSYLISPIEGIVTRMDVKTAGVNVGATTVFTITDPTTLNFSMEVDEADVGQIKEGQSVEVILDSYPQDKINLIVDTIDFVSHKNTSGGNAFYVKATLPKTENKYRVGMGGNADVVVAKKSDVLSVSSSALTEDNFVFVKNGNKFKKTKVVPGLESDISVEIKSGLSKGDIVALDPTSLPKSSIAD